MFIPLFQFIFQLISLAATADHARGKRGNLNYVLPVTAAGARVALWASGGVSGMASLLFLYETKSKRVFLSFLLFDKPLLKIRFDVERML